MVGWYDEAALQLPPLDHFPRTAWHLLIFLICEGMTQIISYHV